MPVSILVAVIGGVSGVIGAIISAFYARRLTSIQSSLQEQHDVNKARRDYEYEARKRLYTVYEPTRFQLVDLIGQALRRISMLSLAPPEPGSLDEVACLYEIIAPAALVRMLDRNLTLADMSLEPQISVEYGFMKCAYRVLADSASISSIYSRKVHEGPINSCEGLSPHQLDSAADALLGITADDGPGTLVDKPVRLMTFSQFSSLLSGEGDMRDQCGLTPVTKLLDGFTPSSRPVFWRCLVAQVLLYGCYLDLVLCNPDIRGDRLRDLAPAMVRQIDNALKAGMRLDKPWNSKEQPAKAEVDANAVRDALTCAVDYYNVRVLPGVDLAIIRS